MLFWELPAPKKAIQRLSDLNQLRTVHNIDIIFWRVGNILRVNILRKPEWRYGYGGAAVLNKYTMVSLHPLNVFGNSTIFIKKVINFVFYLKW